MRNPHASKNQLAFTSHIQLPIGVQWGDYNLPGGDYDVIVMEASPAPLVIVAGMGMVAMIAPSSVSACQPMPIDTLVISPGTRPSQIHSLRLGALGIDLRFAEETDDGCRPPGVLILPLRLGEKARCAAE